MVLRNIRPIPGRRAVIKPFYGLARFVIRSLSMVTGAQIFMIFIDWKMGRRLVDEYCSAIGLKNGLGYFANQNPSR